MGGPSASNLTVGSDAKLLPADEVGAIYDRDSKALYLYAQGKYTTPTLAVFHRLPWVGQLKYAFEGYYTDDKDESLEGEHAFGEKIAIDLSGEHPIATEVLFVVAGEKPGTAPVTKVAKIAVVPSYQ